MKKEIHPKYFEDAVVSCACGNTFKTGSTLKEIKTELCSNCHPFYTGKQKLVDTAGRVEKFQLKLASAKKKREEALKSAQDREAAKVIAAVKPSAEVTAMAKEEEPKTPEPVKPATPEPATPVTPGEPVQPTIAPPALPVKPPKKTEPKKAVAKKAVAKKVTKKPAVKKAVKKVAAKKVTKKAAPAKKPVKKAAPKSKTRR